METVSRSTLAKRSPLPSATYSLAEVAGLWDISYTKAQELAQAGELPVTPIKIGRTYRFPKATVDRLLGIDAESQDVA